MNLATGSDPVLFISGRHIFNVVDGEQKLRTTGITGFATVFAYNKALRSCGEKIKKNYSIGNADTFANVENLWQKEVKTHAPLAKVTCSYFFFFYIFHF
jgi:hypothetical protein